jgi:polar amino acid transport system substrate-binding protein
MNKYCSTAAHSFYRLVLILSLLSPARGHADEQTLQVACDNWPGSCTQTGGVYIDVLKAIYEPHGFTLSVTIAPFKRALYQLEHRQTDLIPGVYQTPERAKIFIYPDYRLSNTIVVEAYLKGRTLWNNPLRYARIRGYEYGDLQGELINVLKNQQAIHLLQAGRADYFSTDLMEMALTLKDMGIPFTDFAYTIRSREGLYVAFSNTPRGKALATIYDQEVRKLYQSGQLQKMLGAPINAIFDERTINEYVHFPEFEEPRP